MTEPARLSEVRGVALPARVGAAGFARPAWRDALLVVLVCILVYWLFLGAAPLASSEGHRVVPGWAMLDSGDWSRTEMFGLNYVRKPPGMPWAIAASSWLLGQSEFAARAPSALACTLMALVALGFGRAWCGAKGGLASGLSQALLPLMWGPGRSAEIEALNTFCTQLAVLPLLSLMLGMPGDRRARVLLMLATMLGVVGFMVMKSVASVPCVAGAVVGACVARRSSAPLKCGWAWGAVIIGGAAAALVLRHFAMINNDADAVREGGKFALKWLENPRGVIVLLPMAILAALPGSLALLFAFGRDARAEGETGADPAWSGCVLAGRACAWAWLASCAIYVAIGLDNPRYLMPASVLLAPVVGYVIRGMSGGGSVPFAVPGFSGERRALFRRIVIRGPVAWAGVLAGAAVVIHSTIALRRDVTTGRSVGESLALALPDGATVWADDVIEARPDVPLYARQAGARAGRDLRFIWAKPRMRAGQLPGVTSGGSPVFVLIRTDEQSSEGPRYLGAMEAGRMRLVAGERLGKYEFALFRVSEPVAGE